MGEERILPSSYGDLEAELGERISAFDILFADSIRYYDSLLGTDARSSPGVEQHFLDRFRRLLAQEGYQEPRNLREALIKLSYGYIMKHR
jgi:hypothetical protein